ncbi:uncharacterized protein LOC125656134 isoform X2 [Ostrea edulis]|uniref:uncharacterized protein LOC125656134 isoform X2 n=1 Tax=Ostrea edulis TaxID=37623 RepID=UPI0024AEF7D8|nr:uncharacterized protein LOC125656134 isoform X2 [Ostrea edulis]
MEITGWIACSFFALLNFAEVFGNTETYEFGEKCSVFWKYLDENDRIYVDYNGKHVASYCNDYSFKGKGDEILDEYEVCITPVNFTDPDCAVRLDYKTSYAGSTLQSVTCTENNNKKYCGPQDETLFIFFKQRNKKDTSNAKFKLLITTKKVFDYGVFVGSIVGGVIGGIVLISMLTGLVCWCVCKRKPTQGQVLNPSQGNQTSVVNQPLYSQAAYSQPAYPQAAYSQPAYPQAAYSAQPAGNNVTLYPTANYATQYSTGCLHWL